MKIFTKTALLFTFIFCMMFLFTAFSAAQDDNPEIDLPDLTSDSEGGKFEVGLHYSSWSINPIAKWFADELSDRVGREIRDEVYRQVRDEYSGIYNRDYEHDMSFDSNGHNYGIEFRFSPKGKASRFSVGFSIEKNRMHMVVQGTVNQKFSDGSHAEVESELYMEITPTLTNVSFRWDLIPQWTVSPYVLFGLGVGTLKGEVGYNYTGTYYWIGPSEQIEDTVSHTLDEAEVEYDVPLPKIFPLLHLGLGLRAEVLPSLYLTGEASFWNGIILRVGSAFRF